MKYFVILFVIIIIFLTVWFFTDLIKNIMKTQSNAEERRQIETKKLEKNTKQEEL